jgi:hypothetical protein
MCAAPRSELPRAALLFVAISVGLALAYTGSAVLFADLGVFRDAEPPHRIAGGASFNAALIIVLGYTIAAAWLGRRWTRAEFDRMRGVVDATDGEWSHWEAAIRTPRRAALLTAAALGASCGAGVNLVSAWLLADGDPTWSGHVLWTWLLNPSLFAALGWLAYLGASSGRTFREVGRRARVRWAHRESLAPFARVGLRQAMLWLVGSSLASLLFFEASVPGVVAAVLFVTVAIGVASLLAPSRGVHERLREAKRAELAWVRDEIERAGRALRAGEGTRLPALLAWQAHVAAAPEWPFDPRTLLRFGLFLLIPLGSWLGGALAERAVDAFLG